MRRILLLIPMFLLIIVCGCKKQANKDLVDIDYLLSTGHLDSAKSRILSVSIDKDEMEDYAYFVLLQAMMKTNDGEKINEKELDSCIAYFRQEGDVKKLISALNAKGSIYIDNGNLKKGLPYIKEAEELLKQTDDFVARMRIFNSLSFLNDEAGNHRKGLDYGLMALNMAREAKDNYWTGIYLDVVSYEYDQLHMDDSSAFYQMESLKYVDSMPDRSKVFILNNAATTYTMQKKYDEAEKCLRRSLAIKQAPSTYGKLARVYLEQGKNESIDSLWKNALNEKNLTLKSHILKHYSEWLEARGNITDALEASRHALACKDSAVSHQQSGEIIELQRKYDAVVAEENHSRKVRMIASISIAVIMTLALSVLWLRYNLLKKKRDIIASNKRIAENIVRINEYEKEISELERGEKRNDREIAHLKQRIEDVRTCQGKELFYGK